MNASRFSAARAALFSLILPAALAGCGGVPAVKDVVQLSAPRVAVLQTTDAHGDSSTLAIQLGDTPPLPLRGYAAARIEAAWIVGNHRLILLAGSTRECPRQETLLVAQGDRGQLRPLGNCQDRFAYNIADGQWSARQLNVRDPANFTFKDGNLTGPVLQSAMNVRRGRPTQPDRPAEPALPAEAGVQPADAQRDSPVPRNPVETPPVSRPVGDDVVPPPVGAGPLPGGAAPPPRVF
jgi:hypothetical protein